MVRFLIASLLVSISTITYSQEITAFGTSYSYGEDVRREDAFPIRLQEKINSNGFNVKVLNFSVSGDTTFDMLKRISQIPKDSKVVIFEYAIGNDQRAGIKRETTESNASTMVRKMLADDKKVILILRGLHEDRLKELIARWTPFIQETGISYLQIYQPASKTAATNPAYYHPNPAFHNEIADQLVEPVQKLLDLKK